MNHENGRESKINLLQHKAGFLSLEESQRGTHTSFLR